MCEFQTVKPEMRQITESIQDLIEEIEVSGRLTHCGPVSDFLLLVLSSPNIEAITSVWARLEKLAFNIHVFGRIHTDYGPDWTTRTGERVLGDDWWPAVIGCMLKASNSLSDRKLAAKLLNAALVAQDIYASCESAMFKDTFTRISNELIVKIIRG